MRITAVAVAVVTASSCVTLYGGAVHRVSVTSTPPDARVFVDGKHAGATPVRVTVSSRDPDVAITVEKDGYPTVSRRLQRSRSVGRILASIGTGAGLASSPAWRSTDSSMTTTRSPRQSGSSGR